MKRWVEELAATEFSKGRRARERRRPGRALAAGPGLWRLAEKPRSGRGGDELSPVGRPTTGGRDERRLERFAEVCQDLSDRPRFGCHAMSRMSPPHPGHAKGNSSPTRAMSLAFGAARCRGRVVCRMSRSSRRWHLRPPHPHQPRHRAACRHSLLSWAVTADLSL